MGKDKGYSFTEAPTTGYLDNHSSEDLYQNKFSKRKNTDNFVDLAQEESELKRLLKKSKKHAEEYKQQGGDAAVKNHINF